MPITTTSGPGTSRPEAAALRAEEGLIWLGRLVAYLAYAWLVFVDILLSFRVLLLLFGANPNAGFARFVYTTSADAMAPFRGLFPPHSLLTTGYLDVSALFAIIVYTLLVFLLGTAGWQWTPYLSGWLPYLQMPVLLLGLAAATGIILRTGREHRLPRRAAAPFLVFCTAVTLAFMWLYV